MPHPTFFNLPADKRNLIFETAVEEFYELGYAKASISRIVAKTGIAKGSFYQYFEDKKDLYKHVLEVIGGQKADFSAAAFRDLERNDLLQTVRGLFVSGIRFYRAHPKLASIAGDFAKLRDPGLKREITGDASAKSNEFFIRLIERQKESGRIAPDVDAPVLADLIAFLSVYVAEHYADQALSGSEEQAMKTIDSLLWIVENGIAATNRSRR
ncbi:TetR/AcrR family transcriptional regulator [Paenibacillus elgii]|uniref:TetR/AcrR family transcriptional regulator n=1 Tax=Paenibacillus elgii TaxID=189691 RepID=UPI002D7C393E|nr:TetR/AcrR family transcriptional regulator [Paenibacillus elgii]